MTYDVFISFSFDDQDKAEFIVNTLTNRYHMSCWICSRNIEGGRHFKELIPQAIRDSKAVVFLQSTSSLESREIPKEISIAIDEEKTIIPFRLDDTSIKGKRIEYDLHDTQYIDGFNPPIEQRIDELAMAIVRAIGKVEEPSNRELISPVMTSSKINRGSGVFYGRDEVLRQIEGAFQTDNIVFLYGIGGIGKSRIAKEYWRTYKEQYSTVVFARYEDNLASLIADDKVFCVSGISRKTKPDNTLQTDEEYASDKLKLIKSISDEHTLLIIDNYDVVRDPFFEEMCDGDYRVLVTTRCKPDKNKYLIVPVSEIDDESLKRMFIEYANPDKTIIDENDDFSELFQLTNRHTYTLELVARFMEARNDIDEISEMVAFLKKHGLGEVTVDGYDNICKLFRLSALNETERSFLRYLAIMPPVGIKQKYFKKWAGEVFSARSHLFDLGLVKIDGETRTIGLHPIIREICINELKPNYENCRAFVDSCAMVFNDAIPEMWGLPYTEKEMLFECYKSITKSIPVITRESYRAYVNMSYMYNYVGSYEQALELHGKIYDAACELFGKESDEAMLVYNHMGWKNANCELYEKALEYYRPAADWFFGSGEFYTYTRESHDVIRSCGDNYYYLYKKAHRLQERDKAVEYRSKAFEYLEKATKYVKGMQEAADDKSELYKVHLKYQVDSVSRNYYKIYLEDGNFDKAEECLNEYLNAVTAFSKYSATADADMAGYLRHLALLHYAKGEYAKALQELKESYMKYETYFSSHNSRTIQIMGELAKCYWKCRDIVNAKEFTLKAIAGASEIYTADHPRLIELRELLTTIENAV